MNLLAPAFLVGTHILGAFTPGLAGALRAEDKSASVQLDPCYPEGTMAFWRSGAPPLRSPEIAADGRVTLRMCAPEANSVRVSGETQWT